MSQGQAYDYHSDSRLISKDIYKIICYLTKQNVNRAYIILGMDCKS